MTTRFYAVDAEGVKWTLGATNLDDAITEVEGSYYLRKITVKIIKVITETACVWSADEAAD
ncbi:hypothetical protein [Mesorhizobium sp.]|uniref:hypothetical protein n=1 Tax=Mesorhizobium sp. TaxID=1871066 RepID=UPI000FE9CFD7|nr:hypothetical protein [Mesorhizobium sp.]RWM84319.1 MAG: hypothetical protein EOR83_17005 [Mesorhizobium sp.]